MLTLPLLVPLSDLIGLSRQVTVLAYQYGAGLCEIVTPTNGALMAMLAAAGVRYEEWLGFVVPLYGAAHGVGGRRAGRGGGDRADLSGAAPALGPDQPFQRLQVGEADVPAPFLSTLEGDDGGDAPDAEARRR